MQPLQICIGSPIRIGRESWSLPYEGFFKNNLFMILQFPCIYIYICICLFTNNSDVISTWVCFSLIKKIWLLPKTTVTRKNTQCFNKLEELEKCMRKIYPFI